MDIETSFGRWLRARRRALDLTQSDLARQVGCSVVTIRKLEADERRPSRQIAERLADSLMVAADQRAAVITLARSEPYLDTAPPEAPEPPLRVPERPPTNLIAPLTRLIGRKQDLAAVRNALLRSEARLLTLIGPPGIGKTRLSIAVAHDIQAAFADGAYFVALAPLGDPALVLATIAQMLEVRETAGQPLLETLKRVLHARRLLLLLDNFEHLLDAAPLVVELLEACPGLKALVTSRAALHVRGERLYAVPPLLLPDLTHLPATVRLARNPAIALFVERAQAVMPDFRLTEQNAPAVAAICARLEGLPLALELAATRIKLLSPETLLARLEQRLSLLTDGARDLPPRHRTLRAAIEWSYELLDVGVQTLFCRLGVFVGGCTLDAATAVSNTTNDVLVDVTGGIASLLDKSLLQQVEGMDGEARFTMLETIREYALERLEQSGEAEAVRQRHAEYCLALAEIAEPHLQQHDQLSWLDRLEREHDNLRAALRWVLDGDAGEIGLRLAAALAEFWFIRSYRSEARGWFEAVLAHPNAAAPTPVRAKVLLAASSAIGSRTAIPALAEESLAISRTLGDTRGIAYALMRLGWAAYGQGDDKHAVALFEESLALCRVLGDETALGDALRALALLMYRQGDHQRWIALIKEALRLARELGNRKDIAACLNALGHSAQMQDDYGRAATCYEESLHLAEELGNKIMVAVGLLNLGFLSLHLGQIDRATLRLRESLLLSQEENDILWIAVCLAGLAGVSGTRGRAERAAQLSGAIGMVFGRIAAQSNHILRAELEPLHQAEYERAIMLARAQLGEAAWAAAYAQGRALPLEQAIAYALSEGD